MSISTDLVSICIDGCSCDVAWIGDDYWQWHKRGMQEGSFCLGVVAQCLVTGLLVTRPGFDSGWKLTLFVPLLV